MDGLMGREWMDSLIDGWKVGGQIDGWTDGCIGVWWMSGIKSQNSGVIAKRYTSLPMLPG